MANTFQPDMGQAGAVSLPSPAGSSIDFSGIASTFRALTQPRQQSQGSDLAERRFRYQIEQDAQEEYEGEVQSETLSKLLDLRNQSNNVAMQGQQVEIMRDYLNKNTSMSTNEREFGEKFISQFDKYHQARLQGIGNEAYYNTKVNNILKEAATRAPGIADDLYAMATGELSDFSADIGPNKDQIAFHNQMVQEHGALYTPDDVNKVRNRSITLAGWEERGKLGELTSTNLLLTAGDKYSALSDATMTEAMTAYTSQGLLHNEQIEQFTNALGQNLEFSKKWAREAMLASSARTGATFSAEDLSQVYAQIEDKHSKLVNIFKDKDPGTRLKLHNDLQTEAFKSEYWALMTIADEAESLGGIRGVQGLHAALRDDNLKDTLVYSGKGFLDNLNFTETELVSQLYNLMMTEFDPKDEGLRRAVATMSAGVLKNTAVDQAGTQFTDYVKWLSEDDNGIVVPGNVKTASELLVSMDRATKSNYVTTLEENSANRTAFKNMARSWLSSAIADAAEESETSDVSYNPRTQRFQAVSTVQTAPPVGVGVEVNPNTVPRQMQQRENIKADIFNNLLTIARDPRLGQYFMDPEELVKIVQRDLLVNKARSEETTAEE